MKRADVCVATSYTPDFASVGDYAAMTIRHYARRHGLACEVVTDFKLDRPPYWHRIKLIENLFDRGHEFVMWLDADALFCRFDVDVRTLIEPGVDFYIVAHRVDGSHLRPLPNTGVMLIRNSAWSRDFLQRWWSKTDFTDRILWDNGALFQLMGYNEALKAGPDQIDQEILRRTSFLSHAWNTLLWIPETEEPIIKHWAGAPRERRDREIPLEAMKACFRALDDLTPTPRVWWRPRWRGAS